MNSRFSTFSGWRTQRGHGNDFVTVLDAVHQVEAAVLPAAEKSHHLHCGVMRLGDGKVERFNQSNKRAQRTRILQPDITMDNDYYSVEAVLAEYAVGQLRNRNPTSAHRLSFRRSYNVPSSSMCLTWVTLMVAVRKMCVDSSLPLGSAAFD